MIDLKNLLGDGFCEDSATLSSFKAQGVTPSLVCAPVDEAQAAATIKLAIAHKLQLVPFGNGTQQGNGKPPSANFTALSTRRLNRLVHHEPGDMVASVQAGMELGALQEALALRGQWLSVDGEARSTIGGLISADFSGPLSTGYGTLRDLVLAITIVHGDGVVRKIGGKVVKNVTGYALEKLYIGALGTLGLITEVTFKLQPLPVARAAWSLSMGTDVAAAFKLLRETDARNLPLEQLVLRLSASKADLYAQAAGSGKELERIGAELRAGGAEFVRADAPLSWSPTTVFPAAGPGASLRFWSLRAGLEPAYRAVSAILPPASAVLCANTGRLDLPGLTRERAQQIGAALAGLGCNYRFEKIDGVAIDSPVGPSRADFALMQRIKSSLDPHGIFNTGRFVC